MLYLSLVFRTLCDFPLPTPQPFSLWSTLQPFLKGTLALLWLIPPLETSLCLCPLKCGCVQADPPRQKPFSLSLGFHSLLWLTPQPLSCYVVCPWIVFLAFPTPFPAP